MGQTGAAGKSIALSGFTMTGVVAAVPRTVVPNMAFASHFSETEIADIAKVTGVVTRRRADAATTTADLCFAAAQRLLTRLSWERSSVDALVFVSQTPDYRLPATSCVLQRRLELSTACAAFDVNLGCSGYTYGLWLAGQLLGSGAFRRVLLLVGDTIGKIVSDADRATGFLFGDAGSATALEANASAAPAYFCLGTDGAGEKNLIVPEGGFRIPSPELVAACTRHEGREVRRPFELYMNGGEIFNFTLRTVAGLLEETLRQGATAVDAVDAFCFHQANAFMLKHLAKKAKLPPEKVPLNIDRYGNTSCASIPLLLADDLGLALQTRAQRLCLLGFGVGYSWASALLTVGPLSCAEVVEV